MRGRCTTVLAALAACLAAAGCGGSSSRPAKGTTGSDAVSAGAAQAATAAAAWIGLRHVRGVVDLSSPRPDGSLVVAARGRLDTLTPSGALRAFAPGYAAPPGLEPYLALSTGRRVPGAGCSFPRGSLFALRLARGNGVTSVTGGATVRRFTALPPHGLENGIAFDTTGHFGSRLLVTRTLSGHTTVAAIDCRGRVRVVTANAPRVEGGLAVAPARFGRFAGDLIAPDELSGNVWAIAPDGRAALLARSGLAHGPDTGVESAGFVPARFAEALVADRHTARNRHPGDDEILGLTRGRLLAAGVRPGDLLVVAEGGAATIDIRCRTGCVVRRVATGPWIAHIEGHVVFSGGL